MGVGLYHYSWQKEFVFCFCFFPTSSLLAWWLILPMYIMLMTGTWPVYGTKGSNADVMRRRVSFVNVY